MRGMAGRSTSPRAPADGDPWVDLFREHASGFVVSAPAAALERLAATGVPVDVLGTVGGDGLDVTCGAEHARWPLPDLRASGARWRC